jgi:hypothetical protein
VFARRKKKLLMFGWKFRNLAHQPLVGWISFSDEMNFHRPPGAEFSTNESLDAGFISNLRQRFKALV